MKRSPDRLLWLVCSTSVALGSAVAAQEPCKPGEVFKVPLDLNISDRGKPTSCRVRQSSGRSEVDQTTCKISLKQLRFKPAKNSEGKPIASTFTFKVVWKCADLSKLTQPDGRPSPQAREMFAAAIDSLFENWSR